LLLAPTGARSLILSGGARGWADREEREFGAVRDDVRHRSRRHRRNTWGQL